MYAKVDIINNPYEQKLRILINSEPISVYSNLEKFMDEPFDYWCDKILPAVYEECNGSDYVLSFSSREEEIEIMEVIAAQYPHCRQFSAVPLLRATPLAERLKELNNLVKSVRRTGYHVLSKSVLFVIPESMRTYLTDLIELDVKNSFCSILPEAMLYQDYIRLHPAADITILLTDGKTADEVPRRLGTVKGFCVILGDETGFRCKQQDMFVYMATENDLFSVIFKCLLLSPLMMMFRTCISSLSSDIVKANEDMIAVLQSVTYRIIPVPESRNIEVGRSVRIGFQTDIKGYEIKGTDLQYSYSKPGIIKCNGMQVEGLKAGNVTLYITRQGEQKPCTSVDYSVVLRNRITDLKLDEDSIILGLGDRKSLKYTFFPIDADNENTIEWESDDRNVVSVDEHGSLYALKVGECTIRCYAEQVSAACHCRVKPYLQSISVDEENIELLYGQSKELKVLLSPENSINDTLIITSKDMRIVNVIGRTLHAVGYGSTRIVVQNEDESVGKEILVSVLTEKEKRKLEKQKQKMDKKAQKANRRFGI